MPKPKEDSFEIAVRVTPRAGKNRSDVQPDGSLKVWVAAPPAEGEANAAVCETVASALRIAKSRVSVLRGPSSRNKVLLIEGLSREEALSRLRS